MVQISLNTSVFPSEVSLLKTYKIKQDDKWGHTKIK